MSTVGLRGWNKQANMQMSQMHNMKTEDSTKGLHGDGSNSLDSMAGQGQWLVLCNTYGIFR